jgi:excisionase family DNA binding protein
MEKPTYLEVANVAHELGVTTETVKAMVKAGKLATAATTLRGLRLFERAEVERCKRARAEQRRAISTAA